jgi:hypothetical protein
LCCDQRGLDINAGELSRPAKFVGVVDPLKPPRLQLHEYVVVMMLLAVI